MELFDYLWMLKTGKTKPGANMFDILLAKKKRGPQFVEKTIIGNPLSFITKKAQTAVSTKVSMEPIQAGSGDPSPTNIRPISGRTSVEIKGCGKNLFDKDNSSSIINANIPSGSSGTIPANANSRLVFIKCKPNTTYTVSKTAGARFRVATTVDVPADGVACSQIISDNTASSITITTNATAKYLCSYVYNTTVDSVTAEAMIASVQIEEGFTVTIYEPYSESNDVTITFPALGKNLFDKDTCVFITDKYISATGEIESNGSYKYCETYIPVKPSTNYVFSGNVVSSITTNSVAFYSDDKSFISRFQPSRGINAQFTTPENTRYIRFNVGKAAYNVDTIQIEEGSTATSYEPYTNTVYGGTLDVETGVLTVDRIKLIVSSCFNVSTSSTGVKYASVSLTSMAKQEDINNKNISSAYKFRANVPQDDGWFRTGRNVLYVYDDRFVDKTTADNILVSEKPEFVYELATPTTISLTPEQIQILKGQNTIWIEDEGASIELTYKAPKSSQQNSNGLLGTQSLQMPLFTSLNQPMNTIEENDFDNEENNEEL